MELNEQFTYRGSDYSTTQSSEQLPRHRWYLIKEGFSPKLVNAAVDSIGLRPSDYVVDPFAGCGTTPLSALERGINSLGVEVNPFLSFVSNTKLGHCNVRNLRLDASKVLRAMRKYRGIRSPLQGYSTFSPGGGLKKWLFNTSILKLFAAGIVAVNCASRSTRRFLRLALVKTAMENCNAKADGKCLRYKKEWDSLDYGADSFRESFESNLSVIADDLDAASPRGEAHVINGDSRKVLKGLSKEFRLCITSPPYLNSFDYSDVYRPEMFLMGFVRNTKQLQRVRLRTIRSHVQVSWARPTESDFGRLYKQTIKDLHDVKHHLWNARIPAMVQAYFQDMKCILGLLLQKAASDAQIWLVVSTSAYGGVRIPVDLILAEIGTQAGWFLKEIGVIRNIRPSGHHWSKLPEKERSGAWLRESVVVLTRTGK